MTEETGEWLECVVDKEFEIWNQYPYPIRRKGSDEVISEWIDKNYGYVLCCMNKEKHRKHRIIAQQFIPNPDNLTQVDHINRIKTDNRIENLRWVSNSENNKNRTGNKGITYEFFDEIPCESTDDIIEVKDYGNHEFEDLYYYDNYFYFFNGIQYRRLHINTNGKGYVFVRTYDVEGKLCQISYSKFKRLHNIQ